MKYFDRNNNILTDTILGMTHVRTLNEFVFNSIVTLFSLIFGYFNSMFLEKTDLFIAVLLVICFDNILGQIIAIKTKKYNKRLKKWGTAWETQKALKGVYYLVGYSAIVAVVLSIQKGFPAAGFLDEAVVLPILMFQFVWILTNNLYCYMIQFKHLDCETHQDEKFIHYCQDCHYPLCPECLYPHT